MAGAFIGIAYWNVIGEDRRPASAAATGGPIGPGTNQAELQDHPEMGAREEKLRELQKMREADREFALAIEEELTQTHRARQAAAQEAKRQAAARAEAERPATAQEAERRTDAKADAERQVAAQEAERRIEAQADAERQAVAQEAERWIEAQADAERQAAAQEAKRQADETAAELVSPSPGAPAPVAGQAIRPTELEPEGAPGLLVKVRSGETLQTLYLRVYRGLTPPPFESVAAINPERIRPGDILIFPTPVNGWTERNDANAASNIR